MTTIDHQQAAIDAAAEAWWRRDYPEYGPWQDAAAERPEWASEIRADCAAELTAATPHLRAGIAEEVRNLRSQFHDDAKTAFGRIGSSTQVYLDALDDVLTLLKGGAEDDSIVAEKSEAALPL